MVGFFAVTVKLGGQRFEACFCIESENHVVPSAPERTEQYTLSALIQGQTVKGRAHTPTHYYLFDRKCQTTSHYQHKQIKKRACVQVQVTVQLCIIRGVQKCHRLSASVYTKVYFYQCLCPDLNQKRFGVGWLTSDCISVSFEIEYGSGEGV